MVKVGQKVRAKIILLEPQNRKIGLTMKDVEQPFDTSKMGKVENPYLNRAPRGDRPERSDRSDRPRAPRPPREEANGEKPKLVIKTKSQLDSESIEKTDSKVATSKDTKEVKETKKSEKIEKTEKAPKAEKKDKPTEEKVEKTTKTTKKAEDKDVEEKPKAKKTTKKAEAD